MPQPSGEETQGPGSVAPSTPAGQGTESGDRVDPPSPGRNLIGGGSYDNGAKPIPRPIPGATAPDSKPGRVIKTPRI